MQHMSMAGQVALRLEQVLRQGKRGRGLFSMPADDATCFFEDPLGIILGDQSPKCPPDPPRHPVWRALADGIYQVPYVSEVEQAKTVYWMVGNGNLRYRAHTTAQWCFLIWVYCYQSPEQRYEGFYRALLHPGHRQRAPYGRIWGGYLLMMEALAARARDLTNQEIPAPPLEYEPFLAGMVSEPAWVDALGRLGPYHDAAHDRVTARRMLGEANLTRTADWHWEANAAVTPRPTDVRPNRVSSGNYLKLVYALTLDRWMSTKLNLRIDTEGKLAPPTDKLRGLP